jgi:AcrR family transcriptional regulator
MQAYNCRIRDVAGERRKFRREGEGRRREAMIAAALEIVGEAGVQAATVRAIAERAQVTPGLIRHYFATKNELTRAAFRELMDRITRQSAALLDDVLHSPEERLAAFVVASLSPPVVDREAMTLWAGFIHLIHDDPEMRDVHEAAYLAYRNRLEGLIAELARTNDPARLRAQAIACNAVIDGLWLEGSALPDSFEPGQLAVIGLASVGAIIGADLLAHASALTASGPAAGDGATRP